MRVLLAGLAAVVAKPNIVVLLADDHSAETVPWRDARLSKLGAHVTPRLARLAKEGATVENYFVVLSLCTPARASLLTGLYPHAHGATHLKTVARGTVSAVHPDVPTYPQVLAGDGYATAVFGKWHMLQRPSFQEFAVFVHQGTYDAPALFTHKKWVNKIPSRGKPRAGYSSDVVAQLSIEWLRRQKGPFLLEAHFKEAHEPWQYPHRYDKLLGIPEFDEGRWTLAQNGTKGRLAVPEPPTLAVGAPGLALGSPLEELANKGVRPDARQRIGRTPMPRHVWDAHGGKELTHAKLVADYMRTLAALDDAVGRIVDAVEDEANTIVVFTSDHGYFLGEHNFYTKRLAYDESIRAPLIVKYPSRVAAGKRLSRLLAANVDIAPTLLHLADASAMPAQIHGRSFASALTETVAREEPHRAALYYRYYDEHALPQGGPRPSHLAVRTLDAKLILYDGLLCSTGFRNATTPRDAASALFEYYDLSIDARESRTQFSTADSEAVVAAQRLLRWAMTAEGGEVVGRKVRGAHLPHECLDVAFHDEAFLACLRDHVTCRPTRPPHDETIITPARHYRVPYQSAQTTLIDQDGPTQRRSARVFELSEQARQRVTDERRGSNGRVVRRHPHRERPVPTEQRACDSVSPSAPLALTMPYNITQRTAHEPLMYVHMQKAAGTEIAHILQGVCRELRLACESVEAVSLLEKKVRMTKQRGAFVVGSVRNPFDWYVSLYAYGCSGRGSVFAALRKRELEPFGLEHVLSDVRNVTNFRTWLRILFWGSDAVSKRKPSTSIDYLAMLSDARYLKIGFMTYRFASLYVEGFYNSSGVRYGARRSVYWRRHNKLNLDFFGSGNLTDRALPPLNACDVVRTESLADTLAAAVRHYTVWRGLPVPPADVSALVEKHTAHRNAAPHRTYRDYYDDETRRLVEIGDGMILRAFGYEF